MLTLRACGGTEELRHGGLEFIQAQVQHLAARIPGVVNFQVPPSRSSCVPLILGAAILGAAILGAAILGAASDPLHLPWPHLPVTAYVCAWCPSCAAVGGRLCLSTPWMQERTRAGRVLRPVIYMHIYILHIYTHVYIYIYIYIYVARGTGSVGAGHSVSRR